MPRTRNEAQITTRNARRQLAPRKKPYCRSLGPNAAIGYQRKERGGIWKAIESLGNKRYREERIGIADDFLEPDGIKVLDFEQAKKAVTAKIASWLTQQRVSADVPSPTVRSAVETYVSMRDARERAEQRARGDARNRLALHVLEDKIADVALSDLTEVTLGEWLDRRPSRLARSTVRRIVNDLRASLNMAFRKYRAYLPADLPIVIRHGLATAEASSPMARDGAALPDDDIRRVLRAAGEIDVEGRWEGDLVRLVAVLAASGARFSQIVRMSVSDVQTAQSRLMVPTSRKGRGQKKATHVAMRVGKDVIELLGPAIAGRRGTEPLLERWRHVQVRGTAMQPPRWVRNTRGAWNAAAELTRPWLEIVTRAGLPADVVPYSLRHSSIVRMLRSGLPTRLVAQLHDTSTTIIERHYAASVVDIMDDLAARAVVPLLSGAAASVVPFRSKTSVG